MRRKIPEVLLGSPLVQFPAHWRTTVSRFNDSFFRQVCKAVRNGGSTTSLGKECCTTFPVKCALLVQFQPPKLQLLAVASCVAVVHYKEKLGSVSCFLPELYTLVWKCMQQECAISAFSICTTFQLVFGCRLPSLKLSSSGHCVRLLE